MTETSSAAELAELRDSVRDFLAAKSGEQQLRAAIETESGYDEVLWRQMASQLSLPGLALPEEYGGDGFGFTELQVVLEEMGRALTPSPFLASAVLAAGAILAAGDEVAAKAYLPGIASGQTTAALAVAETAGLWSFDQLATTARPAGDGSGGWLLAGTKQFVLHGATAGLLIVAAHTGQGPAFFAVQPGQAGPTLTRTALRTLDLTRPMATLQFSDTAATLIGTAGAAGPALDAVLDLAMTALAADQAGAARACLEASAAYARERHQFGRAIGSFQAVKHKCADMLVKVELAQAAATEAARAAAGDPDAAPLPQAAAVAHAVCSESLMFVAAENIQVHGGIGFTWEHPAHLYFRRAKASQLMFGGPGFYFEHLLRRSGV
ncbi:MAG TPA: acyl-CoA dehydrogenase family protein [Trebonia sp.]|jgi:alkylation response protein AidB-like acyl-CoA dehydrogenase|nr:acyl-CoA dehydrogenase family protein [Trebonia sp.]